jgi:hypothetical protein
MKLLLSLETSTLSYMLGREEANECLSFFFWLKELQEIQTSMHSPAIEQRQPLEGMFERFFFFFRRENHINEKDDEHKCSYITE